ncbi:RNA-directed DNA polymerase [Rhizobium leguminosarum]|nr:RNA-directed DNA polymerase [Rhizobium leguminosarum]
MKAAKSLDDLALMLGFTPKGLAYILYVMADAAKYSTFEIPKKTGGSRTISAPIPHLKLLQGRLADLLTKCVTEISKEKKNYWRASHGFQPGKTVVSNAEVHKLRRFVFNLDLSDFFGTINFGRVRGFFIRDKTFELDPAVATVIAQIACHDNALPQGSPCSPVISNLIGNILDVRLLALARDCGCTYTRYADDMTFSTNEVLFPTEIAVNILGAEWTIGKRLDGEIKRAGFAVNPAKTRMSLRRSRQTVTGLVVNAKANINIDYYRTARSMCHSLFKTGQYFRRDGEQIESLGPLEGILSHIYFVKTRRDRGARINKLAKEANEFRPPEAAVALYRKFLAYKYFVNPAAPVIVTEGISDITYIKCAIRSLGKDFPLLEESKDGTSKRLVNFLRSTPTTRDVLNLGNGTAGQASLVSQYAKTVAAFPSRPMKHPVIILCDNDDGPKNVFKNAKTKAHVEISHTTTEQFYYLGENLYLVKVPEGVPPEMREIEKLFTAELLATQIDGKSFDMKKDHGNENAYGKVVFAEKIVRLQWKTTDFSGFAPLLSRLEACITHYQALTSAQVETEAVAATAA